MSDTYFSGDVGTLLVLDAGTDITTFTSVQILVKKPDATIEAWTGSVSDATKCTYTIREGDFDQSGRYTFQLRVSDNSKRFHGEVFSKIINRPVPDYVFVRGATGRITARQNPGTVGV